MKSAGTLDSSLWTSGEFRSMSMEQLAVKLPRVELALKWEGLA
jgi:hypothetical protein